MTKHKHLPPKKVEPNPIPPPKFTKDTDDSSISVCIGVREGEPVEGSPNEQLDKAIANLAGVDIELGQSYFQRGSKRPITFL
jgi:hypothetical protein